MLKKAKVKKLKKAGGHFAIVASRYNARYVNSMVQAARRCLTEAGADSVRLVRVPGAYEIPVAVAGLARNGSTALSAILCLGVVIRGETEHAQLIGESVTHALMQMQVQMVLPIVHEVLLLENQAQARARCLDPENNRGLEAAQTALAMASLMREV